MRTKAREVVFEVVFASRFADGIDNGLKNALYKKEKLTESDIAYADRLLSEDGSPFTAHTTNPVPVVLVSEKYKNAQLRGDGVLADLAPTLLTVMGLPVPKEMTGKSLIK